MKVEDSLGGIGAKSPNRRKIFYFIANVLPILPASDIWLLFKKYNEHLGIN